MDITNQWRLADNKFIRLFHGGHRVSFQKRTYNDRHHRSRGLTIDAPTFLQMDDVSIYPDWCKELNGDVVLNNCGRCIQLTKYCFSSDQKRCNGGFFNFTEMEWQYFWNTIYPKIKQRMTQ